MLHEACIPDQCERGSTALSLITYIRQNTRILSFFFIYDNKLECMTQFMQETK